MEFTYHLKILQKGLAWGVVFFFTAEDRNYNENISNVYRITDRIFVKCDGMVDPRHHLGPGEIDFILKGILRVADQVHQHMDRDKVLIQITSLQIDFVDYQIEGMYWAIIGWLAQRYRFDPPKLEFSYDYDRKKYLINTD